MKIFQESLCFFFPENYKNESRKVLAIENLSAITRQEAMKDSSEILKNEDEKESFDFSIKFEKLSSGHEKEDVSD